MRCAALPVCLAVVVATPAAVADEFSATRSDKLVEKSHTVEISLRRDHAVIEVERHVFNGGERPDQATFHIFPGSELVATGLRTEAIVDGKSVWFEGELMEAEAAAEKYRELTGIGGYYPKDPALLSWRSQGHLALQVFPCMPKQDKRVAYTLIAPMRYENGKHVLVLPKSGTEAIEPKGTVRADGGKGTMDGADLPASITLNDEHRFEQTPTFFGPVGGRLASVPFGKSRVLAGFHLDVAPKLGATPTSARLVVIFDESRSMRDDERAAGRAAARAYLDQFSGDGVKVAVLGFHRKAEDRSDGFVSLEKAWEAIDSATAAGKNGSEVSAALARASALLSQAPDGAARRVVLFTDLLTKRALTPDVVRASLPKGAILHVVEASEGSPTLTRDDDDAWAAVPRATGGVLWRASATSESDGASEMKTVFEELARPVRIDRASIKAPGLEDELTGMSFAEGQGFEQHLVSDQPMTRVIFEGELWSKKTKKVLVPDAEYGRLRAALVFGSDLLPGLSDDEMMALAKHGRAVSPVTSYLAIEPGVRPSTEGLGEGEGGGGRGEGIGLGSIGTIGHGAGSGTTPPDYERLLAEAFGEAKRACGVRAATVTVESTLAETVELRVSVDDESDKGKREACLVERGWEVALPSAFARAGHRTTTTRL